MSEIYRRYNQNQQQYSAPHQSTPQHSQPSTASSDKSCDNPNPAPHPISAPNHNTAHSKHDLSSNAVPKVHSNTPHSKSTEAPPMPKSEPPTPLTGCQCETPKSPPHGAQKNVKKGFSPQALYNLIPKSLYNPETKKILGLLDAEDLLIIALIFLFMEDAEEDNPLMLLALFYILLSDTFDIGDFLF